MVLPGAGYRPAAPAERRERMNHTACKLQRACLCGPPAHTVARMRRIARTLCLLATGACLLAGCRNTNGCGEKLDALISEANVAIRDENPEAMRTVAAKMKPVVSEAKFDNMKRLPSTLESLADLLAKKKGSTDSPEVAAEYSAAVSGFDTSVKTVIEWCK